MNTCRVRLNYFHIITLWWPALCQGLIKFYIKLNIAKVTVFLLYLPPQVLGMHIYETWIWWLSYLSTIRWYSNQILIDHFQVIAQTTSKACSRSIYHQTWNSVLYTILFILFFSSIKWSIEWYLSHQHPVMEYLHAEGTLAGWVGLGCMWLYGRNVKLKCLVLLGSSDKKNGIIIVLSLIMEKANDFE